MASSISAIRSAPSPWIVSPAWDAGFISASPLLIIPIITLLYRSGTSVETIGIMIFAFATAGHHIPGFMRAYGDQELFRRFRWRFLIAPPVVFLLALFAALPSKFGVDHGVLHGLVLMAAMWGLQHGMMQTFGFMRMYHVKLGTQANLSGRLDLLLCGCVTAVGIVFSDTRVHTIVSQAWEVGFPIADAGWLLGARWVVVIGSACVALAYLTIIVRSGLIRRTEIRMKLLLLSGTAVAFWWSGRVTDNTVVGVAVFEAFHALQYYAIVWIYNRKRHDRVGNDFGPLGFMFADRWSRLGLYVLAIVSIGVGYAYITSPRQYLLDAVGGDVSLLFDISASFFLASTLCHYYFDGFIWKIREDDNRETLGLERSGFGRLSVPPVRHLGKCAVFLGLAGLLFVAEIDERPNGEARDARKLMLASWTPSLAEKHSKIIEFEIKKGNPVRALGLATQAVAVRPQSPQALANLGRALVVNGDLEGSRAPLRRAVELDPTISTYHYVLGSVLHLLGSEYRDEAEVAYRRAVELDPRSAPTWRQLAFFYEDYSRWDQAIEASTRALELIPNDPAVQDLLRKALDHNAPD